MSGGNQPAPEDGVLPWTRSCLVCGQDNPRGLRLRSRLEAGRVVLCYTPRETDLGYRHIVHGGIAMTLMDEAMTWAAIVHLRRACVAAEMTTRLRKPLVVGREIRVEAEVAEGRARLVATEARILDPAGTVLATAAGKYVPMRADDVALCAADFVESPDSIDVHRLLGPPPGSGDSE